MNSQVFRFGIIAPPAIVAGFQLIKLGHAKNDDRTFYALDENATPTEIEQAFEKLCSRNDVAIIIITIEFASMIRNSINKNTDENLTIIEIPGSGQNYDTANDAILQLITKGK